MPFYAPAARGVHAGALRRLGGSGQIPLRDLTRRGLVDAERAGADRGAEPAAERLVVLGDAPERGADRAGDVHAGALGVRAGLAVAAVQADGAGQLAGDKLELLAGAGGALGVVEGL